MLVFKLVHIGFELGFSLILQLFLFIFDVLSLMSLNLHLLLDCFFIKLVGSFLSSLELLFLSLVEPVHRFFTTLDELLARHTFDLKHSPFNTDFLLDQ